jgi:hypothetical protein
VGIEGYQLMDDKVILLPKHPIKAGPEAEAEYRANHPDNLIGFTGATFSEIPVESVLDGAKPEKLAQVMIIGMREDGSTYYATSYSDIGEMLLQTEIFKRQMIETVIGG